MSTVTIIYNGDEIRVHGSECRDVARDCRGATTVYTTSATSQREVAEEFYGDFIQEGSMTSDQAVGYSHFLPCCDLPEEPEADHGPGCDGPLNCTCPPVNPLAGADSTCRANDVKPGETIRLEVADGIYEIQVERVLPFPRATTILIGEVIRLADADRPGSRPGEVDVHATSVRVPSHRLAYVFGTWAK